ncbi:ETS-related transcription factor Elf-3-like isoform X2 [Physella acuta]|uniref:ETS-related transcription factor Elf-3-like isoform X2 n=1 Tax=Physella acuta TaxID=109671 RepID=UPI0027DB0BEB|nr:ETS-related transcription factor Elf-3-like isoform X2 [Physella acuta]
MPSASPMYTFSSVFEPETPFVESRDGGRAERPLVSGSYDPFKCLSAMTEQSLTGNFTTTIPPSGFTSSPSGFTSSTSGCLTDMYTEPAGVYPACERNIYSSSSSPLSSPPLSPAPTCYTYPTKSSSTSECLTSPGFEPSASHHSHLPYTNNTCSHLNDHSVREVTDLRAACKKSYPSCSSQGALEDGDRLLSWTRHHPERWSSNEVLDWLFFVAQERGLEMQEFRGENFQNLSGAQLCQMSLADFTRLEPHFGTVIYEMFKALLCGVLFRKPVLPDPDSPECLSAYSPAQSPSHKTLTHLQGYDLSPQTYNSESDVANCNGANQHLFKQERCSSIQNGIDIDSYDFDLDDTPCLTTAQCLDQYPPDYGMYPAQYPQNAATSCCYPHQPYPQQLPRRRPGRPRVKGLVEDERSSKEKKVKNQHLWEFIYETLMNPMYNPQYLRWENQRDGVFRFVQSEAVAQLWGGRKNNENMTYEKLSRAMRHYYRRGILERVEGRRLVYKFSLKAMDRVREKRHNPV